MKTELIQIILFISFDQILCQINPLWMQHYIPDPLRLFSSLSLLTAIFTFYIQNFGFPSPFSFFLKLILHFTMCLGFFYAGASNITLCKFLQFIAKLQT